MKSKNGMAFVLGLLLLAVGSSPALAVSIGLNPSSDTVDLGTSFGIDVVVSELGNGIAPSLGGFDLNVLYDSNILTSTGVVFGPFLGDPLFFEALTFAGGVPGSIDFFEVSLLPSGLLDAIQSDTFTLATLLFDATGVGTTDLTLGAGLGGVAASDAFGQGLPIDAFGSASITSVRGTTAVPEPSSLLLVGTGLGSLIVGRWRKRRRKNSRVV